MTPASEVARHRLAWKAPQRSGTTTTRLAQMRVSTIAMYPHGELATGTPSAEICVACDGFGFTAKKHLEDLEAVARLRPQAATVIDQCHLDVASLERRMAAITALRPIAVSRIAFVGDDDLASVALLRTMPPRTLLVVDVDERVLAVIAAEARRLGVGERVALAHLNLTHAADLAALIEAQGESFDLVVTDPPYADCGMRTFVATAMRLTAFGGEIHIAVPALLAEAWTDELLLQVQSDLIACGFAIERVVPGAFTYLTSDVVSSLVIARRITGSRLVGPTIPGEIARFYTTRIAPERLHQEAFAPESTDYMRSNP